MRAVVLLVLAGCGRWGFAPLGADASDGSTADGTDASADASTDVMLVPADALAPCTKLAISDNFDDGVRDPQWTLLANNPVNVAEAAGQLDVTLASAGGAHYGGYDSAAMFDLRDHCMSIAFAGVPTSEMFVEMDFAARTAAGSLGFSYHLGLVDPFINTGAFVSQGAVAYAASTKVVLVREDSGTTTWETSPDGITFTVIASQPTPFDLSAITIALEAGTFGSAPNPGTALYDDFDLP